ncbi:MAG: 50S ribosomal protein L25 [Deltaproteobacteria bacterium]|nr:50S ribosomal protein L25 [Deltaproteobacteria bacterium]
MAENAVSLTAKVRKEVGKGPSRRIRAQGLVPAVLYGPHNKEPLQLAVDPLALKAAIQTKFKYNTLLKFTLEGAGEKTALLKEVQVDPIQRSILHADFIEVRLDEKVRVNVPLFLTGKAVGTAEGGVVNQVTRELVILALPKDIPEKLEVDVTPLKIGGSIHVSEVKFPAGVTAKTKGDITVAVCSVPEEIVEVAPVAAAVPGAPGAEGAAAAAPGAEGAKPAAGAEGAKPAAAGAKAEPAKKEEKKK